MTQHKTFSEYSKDLIIDKQTSGKSDKTVKYYKDEFRVFQKWLKIVGLENQPLVDFTPTQLREFFLFMSQPSEISIKGRNTSGRHAIYRAVRALFNWVWEMEDLDIKNPIKKVKLAPPKTPPLPEIPTDNIQAMLDYCSHRRYELRDRAIIKTLFDSGVRATELCNLSIRDIDLFTGQVTIMCGKGGKFGITFVGQNSLSAIKGYLETRPNAKLSDPLFPNQEGNRMTYSALRVLISRLSKLSGVPNQGVHSFRRAFALDMWRKTHDLLTVSRLLRHSNLQVTTRYLNVNNEDLHDIHNKNSPANSLK